MKIMGIQIMQKRIVLVEDDEIIRENYCEILNDEGYEVIAFDNRLDALFFFRENQADIALLDISLNEDREGGFLLCADLRKQVPSLPIIFLTSHGGEHDKISGLRLGADDYLTKDISIDYLIIRIEALLRRFQNLVDKSVSSKISSSATQKQGRLVIDENRSILLWDDRAIDLTLTQFWICRALVIHPGQVKSYKQLMNAANLYVEPNTITAHIKTIRNRFKEIDSNFDCIRNERGTGYRWLEL